MIYKSKIYIILSQVFIFLAFFGGMWLNYFFQSPYIYEGEDSLQIKEINEYRDLFYPENGFDFRNRAQVDSVVALGKDPFGGDLLLMDSEGEIIYSLDDSCDNGFDLVLNKYGKTASWVLTTEYGTDDDECTICYSRRTKRSHYAFYDPQIGLMFFYAFDYFSAASDLMKNFRYLVIFMFVVGVILLVISFLIVNLSTRHLEKETKDRKELETAASIQKAMLPSGEKHLMQIDVNARLVPAKKVGGDFYCYILRSGLMYFCIGDVSGKGIPASLFMGKVVTLFRCYANSDIAPSAIASAMNSELCSGNDQNMFLTCIIGTMRATDGVINYVNAGHEPPVVWDGRDESSCVFLKSAGNVPLGVVPDFEFQEDSYEIEKNGLFLMYTDGISEARGRRGYIGRDKALEMVDPYKGQTSLEINDRILDYVRSFETGCEQSDDITLLTFRNVPSPKKMTIHNEIAELRKIAAFVEEVFDECPMDGKQRIRVRSGLDEALTNCVLYAYDSPGNEIEVTASIEKGRLCFTIVDRGVEFDPLSYSPAPSEELKIGGLGISIYKTNFDEVGYSRVDGCNVLKLIKNL